MLIGPKVPICPKVLDSQNVHLPQSPHAHLSQTNICPKCSFALIAQCPFALGGLLIFPGAHFPPNALLPQYPLVPKCPFAPNADLLWCAFFLGSIFAKCPLSPNVHLPQCPSFARCPFSPKWPFAPNTCLHWCSFLLVLNFPKCQFPFNAHLPQCPTAVIIAPIFPGGHFSQVPIYPTLLRAHLLYIPNPNQNSNGFCL